MHRYEKFEKHCWPLSFRLLMNSGIETKKREWIRIEFINLAQFQRQSSFKQQSQMLEVDSHAIHGYGCTAGFHGNRAYRLQSWRRSQIT